MRPVIGMITDGSLRMGESPDLLLARVGGAARAGVDFVQIRERALDDRTLLGIVRRCVEGVRGTRVRVIVNERLDVALAAGAHGVHLKSDSAPASRARRVAPPGFLIGRSIHSSDEATAADQSTDYLLFGTVFDTSSKPGRRPAGCSLLADVVRATTVPVLAVGGVTVSNAKETARAGAAGVAAIGLFANDTLDSKSVVDQIVRAFDLPIPGS